ncbi:hypothetical protein ACFRCI_17400 [Streptomyces sp. NPDC056638]|uniref:hypothetical protein n=1 Tax=Streptomyces sp. NPDC056638 TaxID=3345887 RepID=UPI003690E0C5
MQVQRTHLEREFVQVRNSSARHPRLSLEAVGLLTRLLSLPDGSGATVEKITATVPNGKRSVSKAMNELIAEGYVSRAKVQDPETGRWVTITTVTDTPTTHMPTVGVPGSRSVGRSPSEKDPKGKTPPTPAQPEEAAEAAEQGSSKEEGCPPDENDNHSRAVTLLGRLAASDSRLRLSMAEISKAAPMASQWLAEGFSEAEVSQEIAKSLPAVVKSAYALVSYRLTERKPDAPKRAQKPASQVPRETCPQCDHVHPAGAPGGLCWDCRTTSDSLVRSAVSGAAAARAAMRGVSL